MPVNNTITAPKGFLAAGIHCGIKKSGKRDLGIIACPTGAKAAAVFTTNKVVSAAVEVCKRHANSAVVYAVVANSGNANCCTGRRGIKDAIKMCTETAKRVGISEPHEVLVASTGIIGEPLPIKKVAGGICQAARKLSNSASAGLAFARAIMTTDTRPKQATRRIRISGKDVTIAGAVKGAGMIAPNMATTLLFVTTDVAITKPLLAKAFRAAVDDSLNKLTVDGHQSTNDTGIVLASGLAGNRPIKSQSPRFKSFSKALAELCRDLAMQMALDAEGTTRIFKVVVKGAATKAEAAKAARAVANYPLVKCAVNGGDANWGRIICAVGSAGVKLDPESMSCKLDGLTVFRNGKGTNYDVKKAGQIVSKTFHTITVDLGIGDGTEFCYGCDLSTKYVSINADYHT